MRCFYIWFLRVVLDVFRVVPDPQSDDEDTGVENADSDVNSTMTSTSATTMVTTELSTTASGQANTTQLITTTVSSDLNATEPAQQLQPSQGPSQEANAIYLNLPRRVLLRLIQQFGVQTVQQPIQSGQAPFAGGFAGPFRRGPFGGGPFGGPGFGGGYRRFFDEDTDQ